MTDLQIYFAALFKMSWLFTIVIPSLIALGVYERRVRLEKERMEKAIKWDKLKREYHQEFIAGRK